jgi:hypothetical protein
MKLKIFIDFYLIRKEVKKLHYFTSKIKSQNSTENYLKRNEIILFI